MSEYQWTTFSPTISVRRPMADVLEQHTGRRVSRFVFYLSDFAEQIEATTQTMKRNLEARLFS